VIQSVITAAAVAEQRQLVGITAWRDCCISTGEHEAARRTDARLMQLNNESSTVQSLDGHAQLTLVDR